MTSPDLSATPRYRPAPYLVHGPGAFLTSEELVQYFEDFYSSLGCVNTAPQMVFERLIGNLGGPVQAAIASARRAGASEGPGTGITCLTVPAAVVLPPVVLPAAIPAPVVSTITVPTAKVEQEARRTSLGEVRSFRVDDCPEWDASSAFASTQDFPTAGKADLSRLAIALTSFEMPNSAQLIASASITAPKDTGYSVSLTNAGPPGYASCLKSASCSWIELDEYAIDMQCGVWNVSKGRTNNDIRFPMQYPNSVQILVWLTGLHILPFLDRSVELNLGNRDGAGFTAAASYSSESVQSLECTWITLPYSRPGVQTGTFASQNCANNDPPLYRHCEGYAAFESGRFKKPPKVAVGITAFRIDKSVHLSLSLQVVQVTSAGMKWRFDGGPNGCFSYARGSFIAIE